MSLLNLTLEEASIKLAKKEISSMELVSEYINMSEKANNLNVFITKTFDLALQQAKNSDNRRMKGSSLSDIDGIPMGVKDIFLTKDIKTTNASAFLKDFIAPYESTVTQNLLNAGYVCMGKLNMDEFAMGSANLNSYFGHVVNPWKSTDEEERVPGGSSGASAAAVAAKTCLASLGTDTGGSVRQPASFCGVVGMKPTYGSCSRFGIISFSSSLDQAGILTHNVRDNAMVLNHVAGYDPKESSMIKFDKQDYLSLIDKPIKGLKVGIPKEFIFDGMSDEISNYWKQASIWLQEEGAELIDISLPHTQYALPVYYIITSSEAYSNLSRFDGVRYGYRADSDNLKDLYRKSRLEGWGEEVKRRLLVGSYTLLSENFDNYLQAARIRRLIAQDFLNVFKDVDVILTPTTVSDAFKINENISDPIQMYYNDLFTVTASLSGLPAISLPVGLSKKGLPIGMQLIGKHFKEASLYSYSHVLEQKAQFSEIPNFVKENITLN